MSTDFDRNIDMPEDVDPTWRPTHRLKDIKAGDNSVQLLVSTKDHLYEAEAVEAGADSWQVIGAWEESSLGELSKCLGSRQTTGRQSGTDNAAFGTRYGSGKSLGSGVN